MNIKKETFSGVNSTIVNSMYHGKVTFTSSPGKCYNNWDVRWGLLKFHRGKDIITNVEYFL